MVGQDTMHEIKDTARATVRIGFDGRVHKTFRGHRAQDRFNHEVRVLRLLEQRGCTFVPRLLDVDPAGLRIVTTNCGGRVDQLNAQRQVKIFAELEEIGRHDLMAECGQFANQQAPALGRLRGAVNE